MVIVGCHVPYLEDHPRTCKWLITMVIVNPLRIGLWDPFQMAVSWLINGGDPIYLLTGMILQVPSNQDFSGIFCPAFSD